jgi:hypothetical protein
MEKIEQRESKEGYRTGRTWRSLSKENRRGVQDRQNTDKFEQRESPRGKIQAEHAVFLLSLFKGYGN